MAFPTSHFWAQPSMHVIRIFTQACSDMSSGLQQQGDQSHAGTDQNGLETLSFKGLVTGFLVAT